MLEGELSAEDELSGDLHDEIKEAIKGIGEELFDLKDKLTEGEYLKLMNGLQKVTNIANE